jgi:hypothetical protein
VAPKKKQKKIPSRDDVTSLLAVAGDYFFLHRSHNRRVFVTF